MSRSDRILKTGAVAIYRHPLLVRLLHVLIAASVLFLIPSGLEILNAHPAFYLGEASRFDQPIAAITTAYGADGNPVGALRLGNLEINTTGLLGAWKDAEGQWQARAIPSWLTLPAYPDLGAARRWHFFFAWVLGLSLLVYLVAGLAGGRLTRDLLPAGRHLRGLGASLIQHLTLRHPTGEAAREYNVLQRLAYALVIIILLPLVIATGMAMAPGIEAALPGLVQILGGRQTARTLHFVAVGGLSIFILIHLVMVVVAGPMRELRSIITGWYVLPGKRSADD